MVGYTVFVKGMADRDGGDWKTILKIFKAEMVSSLEAFFAATNYNYLYAVSSQSYNIDEVMVTYKVDFEEETPSNPIGNP